MTENTGWDELVAQAGDGGSRGVYWTQLSPEDQALILEFLDSDLAKSRLNTSAVRSSYKSYLSKAKVVGGKLDNNQKSALKLFGEWYESR
jgi:hypothetical protein